MVYTGIGTSSWMPENTSIGEIMSHTWANPIQYNTVKEMEIRLGDIFKEKKIVINGEGPAYWIIIKLDGSIIELQEYDFKNKKLGHPTEYNIITMTPEILNEYIRKQQLTYVERKINWKIILKGD